MSSDGPPGVSLDGGHEPAVASSSKNSFLKLKCPQWFTSGKYLDASVPGNFNGDFSSLADMDGPKRRGRPPKPGSHQPARQSARSKASTISKPVATRSSRRKLGGVNGEADDQESEMADADAASDETGGNQALKGHLGDSRDRSGETSMMDDTPDLSNLEANVDSTIDGARQSVPHDGRSRSKENSDNGVDVSTTSPTTRAGAHLDSSKDHRAPVASIEAHIHLEEDDDDDDGEPVGMVTRASARSKSAAPNPTMLKGGEAISAMNAEDVSMMDETEQASIPGTPKTKGRGRWPNGPLKARAAAAGVSTATFKKSLGKKKGAPGKRKTSDNAVEQAVYDRQAHLRQNFKDLRKMYLKSTVAYLEREQEQLMEEPDAYKESPQYDAVTNFLENQRTAVVANREKKEQLERQLLERRFEGDVATTFEICSNKIKDLKDKYIMKALKAYMDVHRQWLEEDDEELTDSEDGEYELDKLDDFLDEQEAMTEMPTPEDNEPSKKGRVPKPKRGKKRAGDEPLVQRIAKRHAPAMLSATTHPEEESGADKPAAPNPPPVSGGARGKNKYHFDKYGVYVPTEAKKGPQREEPNNRVVIQPWFEFEEHEIGLRNLYDELHDVKPKPQLQTGYWHVDPHRGVYNISNSEEDYDKKMVETFGVHPTMGLPCKGSRNPDGVFPRTDYERVLKDLAPPLRYVDEEHPEAVSVSKSWDIITTEREYARFERRMRPEVLFGPLKEEYGQKGLATFDAVASDYVNGIRAVDNLLKAAESIERETPKPVARTVSPSPGTRQSARQKARAEALAAKARPATPSTPPSPPPPPIITSTKNLSVLADASQIVQMYLHMQHSPGPPPRHVPAHSYPRSPPVQRTQSQLPHISFINNPMPPNDMRPLAPQPQQPQHHQSQPFLQPRPQPMEMQRQYQGPGMMAPPPLQPRMPLPYPSMHGPQPHQPPAMFYGSHQSPPQPQGPPQRPNLRPGPGSGLRSLLPRTMPGDPPGPPSQHHHINHQQVGFYNPGPPPPPAHMGPGHERFYDGPPQHISPYRDVPYQPYNPGPPGPQGPPPGYGPFRLHSPRR